MDLCVRADAGLHTVIVHQPLCGDLKAEDMLSPFLLMWVFKKLKLKLGEFYIAIPLRFEPSVAHFH